MRKFTLFALSVISAALATALAASYATASSATPLHCPKTACVAMSGSYYVTHVFPHSIDGNGTVTAYVDAVGIAGYGRSGRRTDSWYVVQWDNTGTLTSATFVPGGSAYVGPNGYAVPIPEPEKLTCCTVTNGYQTAYADYVTSGYSWWQAYLQ